MDLVRNFFTGIALGIANVIPGVSGGTMAVIFNVYERLLAVIALDFKKIRSELPFLIVLALGMLCGIVVFSHFLSFLFESQPVPVYYFFIGIIGGSIPFINARAGKGILSIQGAVCAAVGLACMIAMMVLDGDRETGRIVTTLTVPVFFWLFALGAVASFTMIIPGISGSLMLLVLGGYQTFLAAIADFNIPLLIPAGLGVLAGLIAGAGLVRFVLNRFPVAAYSLILGLVIGSIFPLFPGVPDGAVQWIISVVCVIAGSGISWMFSRTERT